MKSKYIIATLLLAAVACRQEVKETPEEAGKTPENIIRLSEEQMKTMELSVTQLQTRNLEATLRLNGKVDAAPSDVVSVTSALGGYVRKIHILPGASFTKGQILAVLEDNQFIQLQQDYLTTRVQLKTAELNYERQKALNRTQAASDKTLQQAEAEYETLKVSRKALEEKLRLIHIDPESVSTDNLRSTIHLFAPFSGTVSEIRVNTGQYVSPTETLFELVNPAGLLLRIKAFEKDLPALKTGQELRFSTNEGFSSRARIISTGKTVNEDGSTDILARPTSNTSALITGMYVSAEIETQNRPANVLPEASVVMFENQWYVFEQLSERVFRMLEVQPGIRHLGWVEILQPGVLGGKALVENGAYTLLMGLKNKAEE
ncbi:efflux RND transporter periplasmic adaptor subunit [Leadbetterella sp. DM7]|uniref:efflux RND transporter periplasmic adaptor subunit n=1 Tax=Leadbetterella sp. DM7 TaxID=3235085 RepID=UPI00349E7F04